jgi:hypothetical protein
MKHYRDFRPVVALFFIIAAALLPFANHVRYNTKYNKAKEYAIRIYGDKKYPLNQEEQARWFQDMSVRQGKKPTIYNLEEFLKKAEGELK